MLSTFHIINRNILHLEAPDTIEIAIAITILAFSAIFFFKSLKKVSLFIKQLLFRD